MEGEIRYLADVPIRFPNGTLDKPWAQGIWQPDSLTPLANPAKMMFCENKLYLIQNERLFVISDVSDPD